MLCVFILCFQAFLLSDFICRGKVVMHSSVYNQNCQSYIKNIVLKPWIICVNRVNGVKFIYKFRSSFFFWIYSQGLMSISAHVKSAQPRLRNNSSFLSFPLFLGRDKAIEELTVQIAWRDADALSIEFHSVLFWVESCTFNRTMKDDMDKQEQCLRLKALSRRQK